MRPLLLLLAAAALSGAGPPPAAPDLQPFEQALAASNLSDAAGFVDRLLADRTPADGIPRSDALLNALLGRLYLAGRNSNAASVYLDRLALTDLPVNLRRSTALAHGRSVELQGDRLTALAAYRAAMAEGPQDADYRRALIGAARQLLPHDQASAGELLRSIAGEPRNSERWSAKYLLAVLSSLGGDPQSAARLASEAWTDALDARLSDLAPLHVAALRAALAAASHDVTGERAMLQATNGLSVRASSALSSELPVCGDRGLKPSDFVIFAFVAGPYLTRELTPVAASRLAAIAPFQDALLPIAPITLSANPEPVGTVFTASCRSVVSPNYSKPPDPIDPLLDWFVEKGIYPASASNDNEDAQVNAVADRIDRLERQFGKNSPLLIGPRWQLILLLEKRARAGAPVAPGQVADLSSQVVMGMRQLGAPEWMTKMIELRSAMEHAAQQSNGAFPPSTLSSLVREELMRAPFPVARELLMSLAANFKEGWPPEISQLFVDLNAKLPSNFTGRERQAWLLSVGQAQKALGKVKEAKATLASASFPPDLCDVADEDTALLEQHFSYRDYPRDLQVGDQEGVVLFDFDLSPSGSLASHRIVYSLPSNLFDEASAKELSTVRYTAPKKSGRASACRGIFQPIIWRLEENDDFSLPTFKSEMTGPTS